MVVSFAEIKNNRKRLGLLGEISGFDFGWLQSLEVVSDGRMVKFVFDDLKYLMSIKKSF